MDIATTDVNNISVDFFSVQSFSMRMNPDFAPHGVINKKTNKNKTLTSMAPMCQSATVDTLTDSRSVPDGRRYAATPTMH